MTRTSKAGREVGSGGTGTEGERVRWFSSPVVVLVYCQARMVVGTAIFFSLIDGGVFEQRG